MTNNLHLVNFMSTSQTLENTSLKFFGMPKGRVQRSKPLGNSRWLLNYPSSEFSMALLTCSKLL